MVSDILFGAVMGIGQSLSAKRDFEREIFAQDREKAARMEELREQYRLDGKNALALEKSRQKTERMKQEAQAKDSAFKMQAYVRQVLGPDADDEVVARTASSFIDMGVTPSTMFNSQNASVMVNSAAQSIGQGLPFPVNRRGIVSERPLRPIQQGDPNDPYYTPGGAIDRDLNAAVGQSAPPLPNVPDSTLPFQRTNNNLLATFPNILQGGQHTFEPLPDGSTVLLVETTTEQGQTRHVVGQEEAQDLADAQEKEKAALSEIGESAGSFKVIEQTLPELYKNRYNSYSKLNKAQFAPRAKTRALDLFPAASKSDIERNTSVDVNGIPFLATSTATSANSLFRLGAYLEALEGSSEYKLESQEATYIAKLAAKEIEAIAGRGVLSRPELHDRSPIIKAIKEKYGDNDPKTIKAWDRIALVSVPEVASPIARDFNEFNTNAAAQQTSSQALRNMPTLARMRSSLDPTKPEEYIVGLHAWARGINSLTPADIQRLREGEVQGFTPELAGSIADEAERAREVLEMAKTAAKERGLNPDDYAYAAFDETLDKGKGRFVLFNEQGERQSVRALKAPMAQPAPKTSVNIEPVRDFESQMEAFNSAAQSPARTLTERGTQVGVPAGARALPAGLTKGPEPERPDEAQDKRSLSERLAAFDNRLRTQESELLKKADAAPGKFFAFLRETYSTARLERISRLEAAEQKKTLERLYAEHLQDQVARGEAVESRRDTLSPEARKVIESVRQKIIEAEKAAGKAAEATIPAPEQAPDILSDRIAEQEKLRSLYAQESRRMAQDRSVK